jgi:capsular polysaccharide biosynthesis protein
MNLDINIQRIVAIVLKKWKLVVLLALIGAVCAYFYTANCTVLTYSSSVEFLAYAQDSNSELSDSSTVQQQASNTSKMNYAIKMLNTYIELFKTSEFNQSVADQINSEYNKAYSASQIKNAITITSVEDTAMFRVVVTTTDADLSYWIAHQLETSIPEKMEQTNNSLVKASVEDKALKATTSESLGYSKKCTIGALAGAILAAAYVILRDSLDIRIKNSDELSEFYEIPVLGSIPEFETKSNLKTSDSKSKGAKTNA